MDKLIASKKFPSRELELLPIMLPPLDVSPEQPVIIGY